MPISCSKVPKMWVPKGKSAQKPRFCARNARKRGFRRAKAHKNADFVLERPENGGSEGKKRTKMAILCSKSLKSRVLKAWAPTVCAEELPTLLEMAAAWLGDRCSDTEQKTEEGDRKVPPSSVCSVRSLSLNLQVPPLWSCTTGTALA